MRSKNILCADFVVVGAGILGLTVASQLHDRHPTARIVVIEKEPTVGLHASGRNSGVLHSGIYYPTGSLKANFCAEGARRMREYCRTNALPCQSIGKVIVPTDPADMDTLMMLYERGRANGVQVELVDDKQLRELEPATRSVTARALFVPETAVVDPKAIVVHLFQQLQAKGVAFLFNARCESIDTSTRSLVTPCQTISYNHLVNTAGLYADRIAARCGLQKKYTMLPFKGIYYELHPASPLQVNRLIYPVPDMNVPFLGVHFTKSVHGKLYAGPTAIPALGREQYQGLKGFKMGEAGEALYHVMRQYKHGEQGFRAYAHKEIGRFLKSRFVAAAQVLIPAIRSRDLVSSKKVGIRAQLLDILNRQLVMDFLTEQTSHETHVLNAVSPAFTSSFRFSEQVVDLIDATL